MKEFKDIVAPYKGFLEKMTYKNIDNGNLHPDVYLFQKWAYRIPRGWYGFSLTNYVPFRWSQIIDDFLVEVEKDCPNFEIHQIKLKYGRIVIYLGNINKEVKKKALELESILFHKDLVY